MVAAQHPLVRPACALEARDDVHGGHRAPVELHRESHGGRSRPDAVGDGQRAAPLRRCDGSLDGVEKRAGIAVADRQGRDRWHCRRFVPREPPGAFDRGPPRCEQVARVQREIQDRAALHAARTLPRSLGIDLALIVAVVGGVGVDQASDRPVLGRQLRLDTPEDPAVAGDDDLAIDVDAVARKQFVVFAGAVVDVDQLARHVAVRRERVVRRQHVRGGGAVVALGRQLGQRRRELVRRRHPQAPGQRRREQHVVARHLRLVSPLREPAPERLDVARVVAGAEVVGFPGEFVHPGGQVVGVEMAVVGRLQPMLRGGAGVREAQQRLRGLLGGGLWTCDCRDREGHGDYSMEHAGIRREGGVSIGFGRGRCRRTPGPACGVPVNGR